MNVSENPNRTLSSYANASEEKCSYYWERGVRGRILSVVVQVNLFRMAGEDARSQ